VGTLAATGAAATAVTVTACPVPTRLAGIEAEGCPPPLVRIVRSRRDWPGLIDAASRVASLTRMGSRPVRSFPSCRDSGEFPANRPGTPGAAAARTVVAAPLAAVQGWRTLRE